MPSLVLLVAGIAAQRIRLLRPTFRLLNVAVLWAILPIVVFVSIARYSLRDIYGFNNAIVLALIGLGSCFVLGVVVASLMRLDRRMSVAVVLNAAFMNVTYLGLPMVYALTGLEGLGPASLYALAIGVPHLIFGVALGGSATKKHVDFRSIIENVVTFPAAFALIVALLFVGFKAPLPVWMLNTFDVYLAKPFFALMLLLIGYQIPLVDPRRYASPLATIGTIRFLVCPLVTYLCVGLLELNIATDISPKPALIQATMPPAVFNMILAHNFKLDLKLYGAIVFYLTFVSIFLALPLMMYLAGFYVSII
ncbi:MAG: AEC family transporter [Candidatus Hodarchaeaceae archaeon]|nr:AEC family transporter [Candidatus Hodarchaeaceae archaeon]